MDLVKKYCKPNLGKKKKAFFFRPTPPSEPNREERAAIARRGNSHAAEPEQKPSPPKISTLLYGKCTLEHSPPSLPPPSHQRAPCARLTGLRLRRQTQIHLTAWQPRPLRHGCNDQTTRRLQRRRARSRGGAGEQRPPPPRGKKTHHTTPHQTTPPPARGWQRSMGARRYTLRCAA